MREALLEVGGAVGERHAPAFPPPHLFILEDTLLSTLMLTWQRYFYLQKCGMVRRAGHTLEIQGLRRTHKHNMLNKANYRDIVPFYPRHHSQAPPQPI